MSTMKVICNKCGCENIIFDENKNIVCKNCGNEIDVSISKFKNSIEKTNKRIIYEIENKVIVDENCKELVESIEEENDLIKYLKQKYDRNVNLSWLNKESNYYNLIIKDVMRSNYFSDNERNAIIETINDNKLLKEMIDESIYKTDKSKEMVKELSDIKIDIVKNAPKKKNDLFELKLLVGIVSILAIFIFGLCIDKALAKPVVIILSIIPACIIGITVSNKVFKTFIIRLLMSIIFVLVTFFIVSYVLSIKYNGFVSIGDHLDKMINAVPEFVEELFNRINIFEEITEPEPVKPEGEVEGGK